MQVYTKSHWPTMEFPAPAKNPINTTDHQIQALPLSRGNRHLHEKHLLYSVRFWWTN